MPRPARGLIGGALIRFVVGAVAVVAAVAIYATNYSHLTAGTIPLMHLAHDWGWTYDDVPDLAGATSVVTGASSGLGLAATIALLDGARKKGYFVVAAVRDPERMEKVALENGISRNDYVAMKLELASLQSVKVR